MPFSVVIDSHSGASHTDYHLQVLDLDSKKTWALSRRYREFRELHEKLRMKFPDRIPTFLGKRLFGNQDPTLLKHRQNGLQQYLAAVLALSLPLSHLLWLSFWMFLQVWEVVTRDLV